MLRTFEHMLDLNRPHSPACPTVPEESKTASTAILKTEVGQADVKDG
jgi:hypothetical protein